MSNTYRITETQAKKYGLINESIDSKYKTKIESVNVYYENELASYKELSNNTGSDDISLKGNVVISWNLDYTDLNYGIENFSCVIKNIKPELYYEYETENGYEKTDIIKLDLNSFEIKNNIKVTPYGNLYPTEIDIDFKRKIINID